MVRQEFLDDNEENLRLALDSRLAGVWTTLPGIITAVNLDKQTCSVQPTIQAVLTDVNGERSNVNLPMLVDVVLCVPRCSDFAITLPIKIGDECLVSFASRCIDGWWQLGQVQRQVELRMHDLSDGFAILAPTSLPKVLNRYSANNLQIRSNDGSTFIELTPSGMINITTNADVNVNAANATVNADTATINAETTINGATQINGETTIVGGLIVDGIDFGSHVHPGVTTGGSSTGGPV